MESPRSLSVLSTGTASELQSAALSERSLREGDSYAVWVATWGERTLEGSLSECLDFMGIYGSARDFHMREACRTGMTGGDLWRVQRFSEQLAS